MTHIYILLASNNIFAHDVELLTWQVPRKSALATTSQVANHMPKTFINKVPTRVWRVSQSLYQHEWTNTKCGMNCWAFKSANTLCQQSQQSSHFFPDMAMIGYDWLWIKTYSTGIGARWTLNYQLFWALPKNRLLLTQFAIWVWINTY